jgi:hypothetical protein
MYFRNPSRYTGIRIPLRRGVLDTTYNNIRARYLIVDGYLNTKILSTHPGIDKVTVGSSGTLLFTPYDNQ